MGSTGESSLSQKYICPACSRQVFNRRYPRCEFCNASLPDEIAYSQEERRALFEAERLASEKVWRDSQVQEEERERAERARGG
jgi:hypothetical protein